MHVSGPIEAGTEPATETAAPRHGAQDAAPDASGFGALLLLLLQPTPTVPAPTGSVPSAGQGPGGDAIVASNPSAVPVTVGIASALGGDAVVVAAAATTSAAPGTTVSTAISTPIATPGVGSASATIGQDARPRTIAPDSRRAVVVAPGRDRTAGAVGAAPAVPPRAAGPDAGAPSASNVVPLTAPGLEVATNMTPVLPVAVRDVAGDGSEARGDVAEDVARAVSAPAATLIDATPPRAPGVEPHAARTRPRDGQDVDPSVDGVVRGPSLPAVGAHPILGDERDRLVMASATPVERQEHHRNGEPDAALLARATAAATRVDSPHAPGSPPPVETPRPVAPPELAEQLVRTARVALRDGVAEMDVQLAPPSLGVVRVTAAAAHDGLGLTLSAERPETRALLAHAIPEMQAALANQGLTTTTIAVAPAFDPPGERRAPTRRDPDRPARPARDAIAERARLAPRSTVGAVDLTV